MYLCIIRTVFSFRFPSRSSRTSEQMTMKNIFIFSGTFVRHSFIFSGRSLASYHNTHTYTHTHRKKQQHNTTYMSSSGSLSGCGSLFSSTATGNFIYGRKTWRCDVHDGDHGRATTMIHLRIWRHESSMVIRNCRIASFKKGYERHGLLWCTVTIMVTTMNYSYSWFLTKFGKSW